MLPKVVWDAKLGTFNLMLPPTQLSWRSTYKWAIINGETKQVLALFIDDKIDTGAT
jgi:hypothetical protein